MIPLLTRIRHAYKADPDSPRINDATPHLEAALCVLLACDLRETATPRQCPDCGTDIAPSIEVLGDDKYRVVCPAHCGRFTPWQSSAEEARAMFYGETP